MILTMSEKAMLAQINLKSISIIFKGMLHFDLERSRNTIAY